MIRAQQLERQVTQGVQPPTITARLVVGNIVQYVVFSS